MDINNMELLNDSGLSSLSGFSYQIIPSERFCEPRQRNLINAEDGIIYKDL